MGYQREIGASSYDVVIIGSGIAGLVCAVHLVRAKLKVLVLEHHSIPGGATTVFQRKQFHFEAGGHRLSGITTPGAPLYEALQIVGKQLKVHPINPSYVVKLADRTFVAYRDLKQYRESIVSLFPANAREIDRYLQAMLEMSTTLEYLASRPKGPNPLAMLFKHRLFLRYARKTVREFVEDFVSNEELLSFLTMLSVYSTLPVERMSVLAFLGVWGAHHRGEGMCLAEGGTQALVDALVQYIDNNGGRVVVKKRVARVLVEHGRAVGVVTQAGDEVRAKVVVSSASDVETYFHLLDPATLEPKFVAEIKKREASGSVFQVYLGIDAKGCKGLENVTTFVGKEFVPPYDRVNNWDLDALTSYGAITVEGQDKAPEGFRSINISCPCAYDHPNQWFLKDGDKTEYRAFKDKIARAIVSSMSAHIPELESRIQVLDTATPLTIERYTFATRGGLQGLAHTVEQSGPKRGGPETPVHGLYRIGQYVSPGAGIVTVAVSGSTTARLLLQRHFP